MKLTVCPCCAHPDAESLGSWSRCPGCGHRWRLQGDTQHSHYQQSIGRNDTTSVAFKRKLQDRLETIAPLLSSTNTPWRILEIGCAEGHLGEALKAICPLIYDGIEISRDAEAAEERLDTVFRDTAAHIEAEPYDKVLAFHVLEHIPNPAAELIEWTRLLAPQGQVVLEVPREGGHPLVISDTNPEHLHQFTLASLLCLLHRTGFETEAISTGHYESAVYTDSIRATARIRETDASRSRRLVERFQTKLGGSFLVYGIGGDFRNYVQPVLDQLPVQELLDSSPGKWGTVCAGHVIGKYDPQRHHGLPVLACSVRFKASILSSLGDLGIPNNLIVCLDEIYDPT